VVITGPWMPPQWVVSGPWIDPLVVPAHAGMVTRGLRLAIGAAPIVLGVAAAQWVNRSGEMPALSWLGDEMRSVLASQPTLTTAAEALWPLLEPLTDTWTSPDPLVVAMAAALHSSSGSMPLAALAASLQVAPSTMLRRVRTATGLTPKQLGRVVRFRAAARRLVDGEVTGAQAAAGGGYADQPHFSHEVRALTGLTPGDLAHRIRRTEHHLKPE